TILNIVYGFTNNDNFKFGVGSNNGAHINVGACGINVNTTRVTNFSHGSEIHGIYFAPTGWLDLGGGNNLYGHFVAQRITGDPNNNIFTCCDPVFPRTQRVDPGTIDLGFNVYVYQNPSKSDFQLEVHTSNDAPVTIQLTDVSGRLVGKINNASKNIPVSVGAKF